MRREGAKTLPFVFPMVFYNGKNFWRYKPKFSALFDMKLWSEFKEFLPDSKFHLCDTNKVGDEELKGYTLLSSSLLVMKHFFQDDVKEKFGESLELLKSEKISEADRERKATMTSNYLLLGQRITKEELRVALESTLGEVGEKVMQSVIGEWIQQGRLEGRQEGRLEGRLEGKQEAKTEMALNLLHKRFGRLNQQSKRSIKKLSLDKLDELIFAILDFQSTKDVSVWLRQHTQKKNVK